MEAWREELYHHGVLGQKWGVQNGPPYPLSRWAHSASEKAAGWMKSLSKGNTPEEKRKKSLAKARKAKVRKKKEQAKEAKKNEKEVKRKEAANARLEDKKAKDRQERDKNIRDPKWVSKNLSTMSDYELKRATERFTLENNARDAAIRKMNTGKNYLDLALGYVDSGISAYNKTAAIRNAVLKDEDPLPLVNKGGGGDKDKQKRKQH